MVRQDRHRIVASPRDEMPPKIRKHQLLFEAQRLLTPRSNFDHDIVLAKVCVQHHNWDGHSAEI